MEKYKIYLITTVLVLAISVLFLPQLMVEITTGVLSKETEQKIGKIFSEEFSRHFKLYDKSELTTAVLNLVQPLSVRLGNDELKISLFKSNLPFAMVLPNRQFVLSLQILNKAHSAEFLLGAIAHELVRWERRDHLKIIINKLSFFEKVRVFLGDVDLLTNRIRENRQEYLFVHTTDRMERLTDNETFEFLKRQNIDPHGLVSYVSFLEEQVEKSDSGDCEHSSLTDDEQESKERLRECLLAAKVLARSGNVEKRIQEVVEKANSIDIKEKFRTDYLEFKKIKDLIANEN